MNELIDKLVDSMIKQIRDAFYEAGAYKDFPETKEARKAVYDFYWNDPKFESVRTKLDFVIGRSEATCEMQGFVFGFRKALEMLESGAGQYE